MRQRLQIQLKLSGPWPDHPFSRELSVMAAILEANPVIAELAWQDIVVGRSADTGAPGMAAMTVVKAAAGQAHIHHPTDSSLLGDLVRVICRSIKKAGLPKSMGCRDRRRVSRKPVLYILNAKTAKQRKSLYRRLMRHCQGLYQEVLDIVIRLDGGWQELKADLTHWLGLLQKVIEQTRQRVILGRMRPPDQKIVSIFETHTDIL
ncbi:MAG: hypothetical protein JRJ59_07155, partial [Deltaproteobacteria bacterium]|nr:hypothetical protein [Deltaproteobacteria bacterium]